jgi:tRNA threonylcarbamoyladenosine biosynthesis protein TsaE
MDITTLAQTEAAAQNLAQSLRPGDVVYLIGEMGTGKTTFTQFVARELGVQDYVNSPTFTLVNEYSLEGVTLAHIDLYRIRVAEELIEMGLDTVVNDHTIVLIEWADLFLEALPPATATLRFNMKGQDERTLTIQRR